MATVLDIVRGLSSAAALTYDGYEIEEKIGLKREEGHPVLDRRVIDGFRVRFAADKLIVTYQSEMRVEELHPRNKFENEIEKTINHKQDWVTITGLNSAMDISPVTPSFALRCSVQPIGNKMHL